ncbi:MAG: hypothetical protein ACRDMX_01605, partial [Solirubrobacteraceae bacterium]
ADRLPEGWDMGGMAAAYRGQARRALTAGGVTYWIVPAREDPGAHQPTPRCLHLQQAAIRKYQPKIPQPLRRPTLDLATRLIAVDLAAVSQRPFDVVCTVYHFHSGGGANCGPTAAEIRSGQPSTESNGVFVGVVPDGVASVTLQVPAQGGRPAGSGTGAVHGNMFAIRVPRVGGEVGRGATAIWRSPTGAILRTVRQPNPGAVRRACRRDPARCLAVRTGPAQSSVASSSTTSAAPAS